MKTNANREVAKMNADNALKALQWLAKSSELSELDSVGISDAMSKVARVRRQLHTVPLSKVG